MRCSIAFAAVAAVVGARMPTFARISSYNPTLFPVDFGADATGTTDSTAAFAKLITALLAHNTSGNVMSGKAVDLGGATVDLQGGDYLLSAPIALPNYVGNWGIRSGSLRASAAFPPDRYLVEAGGTGPDGQPQVCPEASDPQYAACGADVTISDLLLDGGGVAAGGLHVSYVMGVNAGPDLYIVNFTTAGVMITGGHEVMLHQSWIGSRRWQLDEAKARHRAVGRSTATAAGATAASATPTAPPPRQPVPNRDALLAYFSHEAITQRTREAAVLAAAARARGEPWLAEDGWSLGPGSPGYYINGTAGVVVTSNDHYLSDVIVFSGPTYGVIVSGAANLIRGVHTWNRGNSDGGYGIIDTGGSAGGQNRYIGCYADYNDHVLFNPNLITLEGGFYLCGGHIIVAASGDNAIARGVTIAGNQFAGTCNRPTENTVQVDTSNGTFAQPVDFTVRDTAFDGPWVATGTAVTLSVSQTTPTTTWLVDFTGLLLFNTTTAPIQTVRYSFMLDPGQFAASAARKPANGATVVTVETDKAVSGTLTVTVDQSVRSS